MNNKFRHEIVLLAEEYILLYFPFIGGSFFLGNPVYVSDSSAVQIHLQAALWQHVPVLLQLFNAGWQY